MLHLYLGDGKGKSTAAAGLAIRAAGQGIPVIYTQFMKDQTSGEIAVLKNLSKVTVLAAPRFFGFYKDMSEEEKQILKDDYPALLDKIRDLLPGPSKKGVSCLIVLDEALTALTFHLLPEDVLLSFSDSLPAGTELVLTGRHAPESLLQKADYVSEIKPIKHPYPETPARKGIEY